MVQGRLTEADTDHLAGRHSIRTNQCPLPPSPIIITDIGKHTHKTKTNSPTPKPKPRTAHMYMYCVYTPCLKKSSHLLAVCNFVKS